MLTQYYVTYLDLSWPINVFTSLFHYISNKQPPLHEAEMMIRIINVQYGNYSSL